MQGIQRYVVFAFLALGFLLAFTFANVLQGIFYALDVPDASLLGTFTVTSLIGVLLGAGIAFYGFRNARAHEFSSEVVGELKKVTWPSKKETQTATVVVIVTTLIISVILGVFDTVWAAATGVIYK